MKGYAGKIKWEIVESIETNKKKRALGFKTSFSLLFYLQPGHFLFEKKTIDWEMQTQHMSVHKRKDEPDAYALDNRGGTVDWILEYEFDDMDDALKYAYQIGRKLNLMKAFWDDDDGNKRK